MRASPTLRGRSCPVPHGGRQRPRCHLPSPRPTHHGCSHPRPAETHFAVPTLGLAMAPRQTLGGKEDFSSQKSQPKHSPAVGAPRQPLSVMALPLLGDLPRCNTTTPDLAAPAGMAAGSAIPSGGPSTPGHAIAVKPGAFLQRDAAKPALPWWWGASALGGVVVSALPRLWAKHPRAKPEPQRNLFLALPCLPSVLPFF